MVALDNLNILEYIKCRTAQDQGRKPERARGRRI